MALYRDSVWRCTAVVLRPLLVTTLLLSSASFLPIPSIWREINASFAVYYLCLHVIGLLALVVFFGRLKTSFVYVVAGWSLLLCSKYVVHLLPYYYPAADQSHNASARTFSLDYANVDWQHESRTELANQLVDRDPDVVVLLEIARSELDNLHFVNRYPYRANTMGFGPFGLVILSKFPFRGRALTEFGVDALPMILVDVELIDQKVVTLVALHLLPPQAEQAWYMNKMMLRRLTTFLRHEKRDFIVAADLNAGPMSTQVRRWKQIPDLKDAMHGFGLQKTWEVGSLLFHLTIDYVLYRGDLGVENFEVLPSIGSDHYPLWVEFSSG